MLSFDNINIQQQLWGQTQQKFSLVFKTLKKKTIAEFICQLFKFFPTTIATIYYLSPRLPILSFSWWYQQVYFVSWVGRVAKKLCQLHLGNGGLFWSFQRLQSFFASKYLTKRCYIKICVNTLHFIFSRYNIRTPIFCTYK